MELKKFNFAKTTAAADYAAGIAAKRAGIAAAGLDTVTPDSILTPAPAFRFG